MCLYGIYSPSPSEAENSNRQKHFEESYNVRREKFGETIHISL